MGKAKRTKVFGIYVAENDEKLPCVYVRARSTKAAAQIAREHGYTPLSRGEGLKTVFSSFEPHIPVTAINDPEEKLAG